MSAADWPSWTYNAEEDASASVMRGGSMIRGAFVGPLRIILTVRLGYDRKPIRELTLTSHCCQSSILAPRDASPLRCSKCGQVLRYQFATLTLEAKALPAVRRRVFEQWLSLVEDVLMADLHARELDLLVAELPLAH